MRAALTELDPDLAAAGLDPLERYVTDALGVERFLTGLLALFASAALLLALVGLYGVVSYTVNGRLREMGVRLALGASGRSVGFRVVLGSLSVVAAGLAAILPAVRAARVDPVEVMRNE